MKKKKILGAHTVKRIQTFKHKNYFFKCFFNKINIFNCNTEKYI